MNWKNLKIGQKLTIAFAALIGITVIIGSIAIFNMARITTKSSHLADEYVPEVKIANNIERYSLLTMYQNRGYGFTEDDTYLNEGNNNLQMVKRSLDNARELIQRSTQLKTLEEAIGETQLSVQNYERLVERTVTINEKLELQRTNIDKAADNFIKNCINYLSSQNRQYDDDISQNVSQNAIREHHDCNSINLGWIF